MDCVRRGAVDQGTAAVQAQGSGQRAWVHGTEGGSRQGCSSGSGGNVGTGGAQGSVAVGSKALEEQGTGGSTDGGAWLWKRRGANAGHGSREMEGLTTRSSEECEGRDMKRGSRHPPFL